MLIRQVKDGDAAGLLAIYAPYILTTAITFEDQLPSLADFEGRIKEYASAYPYLVAEEGGKLLGYAYAHAYYGRAAYAWTVELAIYIDQDARQTGIGSRLYNQLEKELAKQGIVNLLACVTYPNEASMAFHQKRGFKEVGRFSQIGYKLGKWHDTVWLQKKLDRIDNRNAD